MNGKKQKSNKSPKKTNKDINNDFQFKGFEIFQKINNEDAIHQEKKTEVKEDKWIIKKSKASFRLDQIKSFIYGAMSSRFWMMRKHINE